MQHDRLDTAGDLDRSDGVRGVHDVGRIAARAEGRNPLAELQGCPAVAEPGPVGDRGEAPGALQEGPAARVGEAMVIQAHHHPDLPVLGMAAAQRLGHRPARCDPAGLADRQFVAGGQGPALDPA